MRICLEQFKRLGVLTDRVRVPTPIPSTPRAILNVVRVLVSQVAEAADLGPDAAVGVGIPAPVIGGAAAASTSSSPSAGADMGACASRSGCVQMVVTNRAAKSRQ